jgi:hypothetical protein
VNKKPTLNKVSAFFMSLWDVRSFFMPLLDELGETIGIVLQSDSLRDCLSYF